MKTHQLKSVPAEKKSTSLHTGSTDLTGRLRCLEHSVSQERYQKAKFMDNRDGVLVVM